MFWFATACVLGVLLLVLALVLVGLGSEFLKARKELRRLGPIVDVESEVARRRREVKEFAVQRRKELDQEAQEHQGKLSELLGEQGHIESKIKDLRRELSELEQLLVKEQEQYELEVTGFYHPEYDLMSSEAYAERLKKCKALQKQLIKDKTAIVCTTEWLVDGSKVKGRKQIGRLIKLGLSAFNTQADNIILKVSYKNFDRSQDRIRKVAANVDRLLETNHCHVTPEYLEAKLLELELAFKYAEKKQHEKEEQKLIKEQMREEAAALKEFEREARSAEKERESFELALEKARGELQEALEATQAAAETEKAAVEARNEALKQRLRELEESLEEAQSKERSLSQAQLTRRGHIYVISNVGSFGEGVYKVGMTRRLEPMLRVKELGDASVPFPFDVHAMIAAKDAPTLEKALHNRLDAMRVNRVNTRKEFFRVSLGQIEALVHELHDEEVEFTRTTEAKEYYISKREAQLEARPKIAALQAESATSPG